MGAHPSKLCFDLLQRMVAGSAEGSSTREQLFSEIRKSLLAHARGEEEEFYPNLRQFPELEPLVARSLEEHKEFATYLEELSTGDKATEGWRQRFEQMMRAVYSHVDLEEKQLFPRAKDLISTQQAEDMLKQPVPEWDLHGQPEPDVQCDQRIAG